MNAEFELQLIEALDALDRGEPLDDILARYPGSAAELRPMLSTTAALPALRIQPSEAQKMKSRQAFLKQGAALRQAPQRRVRLSFVPRLATVFAAFSVAFAVLGGGAVAASGSALPGDPLYGLKRTIETARLTFTADASAHSALQAQFEVQRRIEANALLDAGRETEVQFSGPIESIQPDAWVVGGLVVRIDASTQISGQPQIDRLADVRGLTGRSGLRALSITLDQTAEPTPATPTLTPTPTETPAPTATPNPIVTPEPTEPRPTREPLPTATPAPTARPVSIEFTGSVNSQTAASWIIDGASVAIDGNTVFKGNIGVGQRVNVQALRDANGRLLATRIELISDDDGGGSGDDGQNDNNNDNNDNGNENDNHDDNENDDHDDNDNGNENDDNENDDHDDNDNKD
jgi:hypothetical protein